MVPAHRRQARISSRFPAIPFDGGVSRRCLPLLLRHTVSGGHAVDSRPDWLIDLNHPTRAIEQLVGGKAANLARLHRAGFSVAPGFCLGVDAYALFLRAGKLAGILNMELQRKPLETLRWEELWDTALRIRSAFRACPFPPAIGVAVERASNEYDAPYGWAVRSSAPGEDSRNASFAGLHESVLPVFGAEALLDAVRTVWASLWSDAALLYRQELGLDPRL
ncbi:MAG: hypothetical protein FJ189_08905, partial [Gammaproteobacteria bacterium]|nr:hypothetical protein [Gammaproteobacteria bacterium]